MLSLPYRDIRAPKDLGGSAARHIYRHFDGLGDSLLLTRYQIGGSAQASGSKVHALVGLRLPTGSANPNHFWKAANGSMILSRDPVLQTGYGTTDPILGFQWMNPQHGGRSLYVGTLYRFTGGRNDYGYRFGNEFQVTAGAALPLGRNVVFLPQLYGQISGHDFDFRPLPGKHPGEVTNTGGRWLYFMPSVRWNSLEFDVQVPVYRKTNGNILNPSVIFTVRANTDLRLTRAARVQRTPRQGSIAPAAGDFQVVSHGERMELASHASAGKITLFEFASRRCTACQALAPALHTLLAQRPDIALRQIEVINPSAPVWAQYGIQATPAFVIVGRDGGRVNTEPRGFDEVRTWLDRQAEADSAALDHLIPVVSSGEPIELKDHRAEGQVTVFQFFTPTCSSCRAAAPALRYLLEREPDVAFRRVDVSNHGAPVVGKYDINVTPTFLVFSSGGQLVARVASGDVGQLDTVIQKAKAARTH